MKKLPLTKFELNILLQALDIKKPKKHPDCDFWNCFTPKNGADSLACRCLMDNGWVLVFYGRDELNREMFGVTQAGIAALKLAGYEIKEED